ncbi:cytochrome P450 2D15-like [Protopterus annectens]|uniref:cytochrome P450 2D15-like n=1 Tax=Protopterus annectens TaxID=7888 RepID=UPI001CF9A370|nr:cytochrome P450 2D15-like [Protopterus annectens]
MVHFWLSLVAIMVLFLFWKWRRPANFPPGPWALPIIGNFLQVDYRNPLADLEKLANKYGNIYSIFLGNKLIVVLNGFQTVKEALVNRAAEFSDRPEDPVFLKVNKNKGCQFDPTVVISNAVSNVISSILFSQRFDYNDNTFSRRLELIREIASLIGGFWGEELVLFGDDYEVNVVNMGCGEDPASCKNVYFCLRLNRNPFYSFKALIAGCSGNQKWLEALSVWLLQRKHDGSSFDEENLLILMSDLFLAGTDTTATALRWALLLMMIYPNVQEKCHKEIASIVNGKEFASYDDRLRMPYTQAVIHEILRFGNIAPLSVPHGVTKDVLFRGYTIPKGTRVMADLNSVLQDETQWKFPHEFNPVNFLNDSGEFVKQEAFLPFSTGPRICLGENLARMELFLFFTSLLNKYELFWPEKSTAPNITPMFGIVRSPYPFRVGLKNRRSS